MNPEVRTSEELHGGTARLRCGNPITITRRVKHATSTKRTAGVWAMLVAIVAVSATGCMLFDHNLRVVEPGRFYRSGQMPDTQLGERIHKYGIRTVVNLRGTHPEEAWYREEVAVCEALGVAHHDFTWSKNRLPEPESLAEFVKVCREAESPILVHCQGGTHRAGMASAAYQLLKGHDTDTARQQFHLFFQDARIGQVVDLYEGSSLPFDEWVVKEYPRLYEEAGEGVGLRLRGVSSNY